MSAEPNATDSAGNPLSSRALQTRFGIGRSEASALCAELVPDTPVMAPFTAPEPVTVNGNGAHG